MQSYRSYIDMHGKEPNWIWAGSNPDGSIIDDEGMPFEIAFGKKDDFGPRHHGTCMFSKTFGPDFGVSKRTAVTIVRLAEAVRGLADDPTSTVPPYRVSILTHALFRILQDVREKNLRYRAVVNISLGISSAIAGSGSRIPVEGDLLFSMGLLSRI